MALNVLEALRGATVQHHERLDSGLGLPDTLVSRTERVAVAKRFYGWQAGVERALGQHLNAIEGLDMPSRLRADRFSRDFAVLGLEMGELAICAVPDARNLGEALGLLYVVEGSTLGGKVIGKSLRSRGHDLDGLGFLDPYGARTGEMWRGFLTVLAREIRSEADCAQAVGGAVMGFERAELWLNRIEATA